MFEFVEGRLRPYTGGPLSQDARYVTIPSRIYTGKAESEWVAPLFLTLATQDGEWHDVPWRMLRNAYMNYSFWRKLLECGELAPPPYEDRAIARIMGDPKPQIQELYNAVEHMLHCKLIRSDFASDGEAYYSPTENLIRRLTPAENWSTSAA